MRHPSSESIWQTLLNYALDGLQNKVLAREYRLALPEEERLREEIQRTRRRLEGKSGDMPE